MKGYSEEGKLEIEIPYLHGSVEGLVKRYDENGKVVEQAMYKNDKEVKKK